MKILLEYIWIDGNENVRSKNKIITISNTNNLLKIIPNWNFDGSSTNQSKIHNETDVILKPVRIYNNPFVKYISSYLVLCECYNKDMTPHITNTRVKCIDTSNKFKSFECLFGIEQEYVIFERNKNNFNLPYKWKNDEDPEIGNQGPYYCSVGGDRSFGREIANKHMQFCLDAGVEICGSNAEVMASQWEYQIGICDALQISDDLWISRYILHRITEKYNCYVSFHPKPYINGWNGSGGHTNFSTKEMRDENGIENIFKACEKIKIKHNEHILIYGKDNNLRLSGLYETSAIDTCTWGISDRSCSIRIPINVFYDKCGYLEDRRPASNLDPYLVTEILMSTICE